MGKGKIARVKLQRRNKRHINVSLKYGIRREVRFTTCEEHDAFSEEIRLIAELHSYVHDQHWNGVGCNYTLGGEGTSGHVHTLESRLKTSVGNKISMLGNQNGRGHVRSSDERLKIREKLLGHEVKPETRRKISDRLTGRKLSLEHVKRSADGHRGKGKAVKQLRDEQTIAIYTSAVLAEIATGASRSKICECCKGRRSSAGGFGWCYA